VRFLKYKVQQHLKEFGLKMTVVAKNNGYGALRGSIPFDMEYTRDLGFLAAKFLFDGGSGAQYRSRADALFLCISKTSLIPRRKIEVHMVDPESESYLIANRYMIRLRRDDFDDPT
jgi:6-phosphofructokinase 1